MSLSGKSGHLTWVRHTAAARAALPIPVSVCSVFLCPNTGQEQRYPFLSVCAVFSCVQTLVKSSATHSCQCVQCFPVSKHRSRAALPIPISACSVFLCPNTGQEQRYPFLSVCAVFSCVQTPVKSSATHSYQCVQCFPVSKHWSRAALPIPISVCSVFLCPNTGVTARMRRKNTTDQYAEEKRWVFSFHTGAVSAKNRAGQNSRHRVSNPPFIWKRSSTLCVRHLPMLCSW